MASESTADALIEQARARALGFARSCRKSDVDWSLWPQCDPSPHARCFGILLTHFLAGPDVLYRWRAPLSEKLVDECLSAFRKIESAGFKNVLGNKGFMQLLTFTLSALDSLDCLSESSLDSIAVRAMEMDVEGFLEDAGVFKGRPQSGNTAMFLGVLLVHIRDFARVDEDVRKVAEEKFEQWLDLHLKHANRHGFWGSDTEMNYLQFQNGYHQYELFFYEERAHPLLAKSFLPVLGMADQSGLYAPYPGGSGCYDFDAVSILSAAGEDLLPNQMDSLLRTQNTILGLQNSDGGFSESQRIRPIDHWALFKHLSQLKAAGIKERFRYCLALQHPRHKRISTVWSSTPRAWAQSNLWDTWLRMMTVAQVDIVKSPRRKKSWHFLRYPGIGFGHL